MVNFLSLLDDVLAFGGSGDGVVTEAAPASAMFDNLSTANYAVSAQGAGGPDFGLSTTIVFTFFNNASVTTDSIPASYGASMR